MQFVTKFTNVGGCSHHCISYFFICGNCEHLLLLQKKIKKEENEKKQNDASDVWPTISTIISGLKNCNKLITI